MCSECKHRPHLRGSDVMVLCTSELSWIQASPDCIHIRFLQNWSSWGTLLRSTNGSRDRPIDFQRGKLQKNYVMEKKWTNFVPGPYPILLLRRRAKKGPQNVLKIEFENVLKIVIFVFGCGVSPIWTLVRPFPCTARGSRWSVQTRQAWDTADLLQKLRLNQDGEWPIQQPFKCPILTGHS